MKPYVPITRLLLSFVSSILLPFPAQLLFIILKQSHFSFLHDLFLAHADFKSCVIEKQYSMGKTWVCVLIAEEWVNLGESQAEYFEEWMWGLGGDTVLPALFHRALQTEDLR